MILISKKHSFLLILLATFAASALADAKLESLTEQMVCDAKVSLQKQVQRERVLKYALIGAAVGGTGFALFKMMPSISDYCKFKDDQNNINQGVRRFSAISADHQDAIYESLKQSLVDEIKKNSEKKDSFFKSIWNGIPGAIGMAVLPEAVKAIYKRTSYLFGSKDLQSLVKQLAIKHYFERLERSLAQLVPNELVQNINYKNKKELVYDSQQLIVALSSMSIEQQQEHKKALKAMVTMDCNALIKQMAFVIAYMRYSPVLGANQKIIVNNFANQLFQATCEFTFQMQASLNTLNEPDLLNAVVLFQAAFNSAITNFMTFTR